MPLLLEATDPEAYASQLYDLLGQIGDLTGDAETRMVNILDDARADIQDQLAALDFDSPSRHMLNRARNGVDQTMANLADQMGTTVADLQAQGHAAGIDLAIKPLGGERGFDVVAANISLDQLQIMQAFSAELIQDIPTQLRKRINAEITSIVVGAKSPHAAATAIGKNLTDANHFSSIAHRARAIVVTEVGRAQSLGTQSAQDQLQRALHDAGDPTEVKKRWLNAHLPGARATHLEAEARYSPEGTTGPIPANAFYQIGIYKAYYPKDPSLPPGESVHCHCVSITVMDEGSASVAGNPQQLAQAKAAYSSAKTGSAAPAAAKTGAGLNKPAAQFINDPYTAAGLQPVKELKTGGLGYGGQIMTKKLGYADPKASGFVWDSDMGAWKHPKAPAGKQLPPFAELAPAEQLAVMKSAQLSTVTQNQIVKHLDIKKPKTAPYATSKPAAAPPPTPKPKPQPKPTTPPPAPAPTPTPAGTIAPLKPAKGTGAPATGGRAKTTRAAQDLVGPDSTDIKLKERIMKELGQDLDRFIDADRLGEFQQAFPRHYGTPGFPETPGERVASMLTHTWAATSGDANPGSLAVQKAVAKKFGLDWPPVGYTGTSQIKAIAQADEFYDEWSDVVDNFVSSQYRHTQRRLKELGYGDTIRLSRGMDGAKGISFQGETRDVMLNPASSFSTDARISKSFGDTTYFARVPRERILGSCLTGFGCYNEMEFVVIGSKTAEQMWAIQSSSVTK